MLLILIRNAEIHDISTHSNTSRCVLIVQQNRDLHLIPPALNSTFTARVTDVSRYFEYDIALIKIRCMPRVFA